MATLGKSGPSRSVGAYAARAFLENLTMNPEDFKNQIVALDEARKNYEKTAKQSRDEGIKARKIQTAAEAAEKKAAETLQKQQDDYSKKIADLAIRQQRVEKAEAELAQKTESDRAQLAERAAELDTRAKDIDAREKAVKQGEANQIAKNNEISERMKILEIKERNLVPVRAAIATFLNG